MGRMTVNVGNELPVDWNDHTAPVAAVITYVRDVQASVEVPLAVADDY